MRLIFSTIAFCVVLKCSHSQFNFGDYYKQQPSNIGYQTLPGTDYFSNANMFPFLLNNYNYELQVHECDCSCNRCGNPQPCCIEFCRKCKQENEQSGYVFYPYPYIIYANAPNNTTDKPTESTIKIESTIKTEAPTTTEATTTTTVKTTTIHETMTTVATENVTFALDSEEIRNNFMNHPKPILKQDRSKLMLTALRRTKPRWMPKYGIVPIPDQLAENLMLRIRQMKVLHPEKDAIRKIENLYPESY